MAIVRKRKKKEKLSRMPKEKREGEKRRTRIFNRESQRQRIRKKFHSAMIMLQETVLGPTARRLYKKRSDRLSNDSSRNSNGFSPILSTNYDWHRLLMTRLKPGVTSKYRTMRNLDTTNDSLTGSTLEDSSSSSSSSYPHTSSDESSILTQLTNQSDTSTKVDSSSESSTRKENHFVKNSNFNRSNDRITSLKRRVRKIRHLQNQTSIEELTVPLATNDSNSNVILMSSDATQSSIVSRRYRPNKCSSIVPLPPIPVQRRKCANQYHLHELQYNLYAY